MATNFCPCQGSYVLNQFPSIVMLGMKGFHVSASGAIQGHHGPLVFFVHKNTKTDTFSVQKGLITAISTLSEMHHFETLPNSEKQQTTTEIWLLKDFKKQFA